MGGGAEDRHHLLQLMPIDRRTSRRRSKAAPPRSAKQAERRHDRKPRRTPGPEIDSVLLCSTVFVLDSLFYHSLFCDSQFCNSLSSCREVANHRWLIILMPTFRALAWSYRALIWLRAESLWHRTFEKRDRSSAMAGSVLGMAATCAVDDAVDRLGLSSGLQVMLHAPTEQGLPPALLEEMLALLGGAPGAPHPKRAELSHRGVHVLTLRGAPSGHAPITFHPLTTHHSTFTLSPRTTQPSP